MQIIALVAILAALPAGNAWWMLNLGQGLMVALTLAIVALTVAVLWYAKRTLEATRQSTNATKESLKATRWSTGATEMSLMATRQSTKATKELLKVTRKSLEFFTEPRVVVDSALQQRRVAFGPENRINILNFSPEPIVVLNKSDVVIELLEEDWPERIQLACQYARDQGDRRLSAVWRGRDDIGALSWPVVVERKWPIPFWVLIPFQAGPAKDGLTPLQRVRRDLPELRIRIFLRFTYNHQEQKPINVVTRWLTKEETP